MQHFKRLDQEIDLTYGRVMSLSKIQIIQMLKNISFILSFIDQNHEIEKLPPWHRDSFDDLDKLLQWISRDLEVKDNCVI